ncbi:MAG: pyrroline-5-carboxylate reductase [Zoogloeaceae bacterium]|jgi:pyrroline-5-carboxylate reductase|nr:pyrroline-5-carboxylate reductase [Zoogloeaceae bacterium]
MRITFIGGGNMASALIGRLTQQGFPGNAITVVDPLSEQRKNLSASFGVDCLETVNAAALETDVLVLAVKPQQMKAALLPLAGNLTRQVVLSIAAGLTLSTLSAWLSGYRRIVRAMPNTPAMIGAGISGVVALPEVSEQEYAAAEQILRAGGEIIRVTEESQMNAITAISGSGPAYFFLFIEALSAAASELGFAPEEARKLALSTALGATKLAAASAETVRVLRERVTSKGGTTEAALKVMAERLVSQSIIAGAQAACARSQELETLLAAN